ncbi:carboxymuconolactone decarboxylase family protein [Streptomyces anthocyanicus]|uniref:carboxymuconolactone decarboxylase family protein n=1 Tax=Streptomyces anthocyanicus TaxID=68174 RepID=UPI002F906802|nr:carboxymuconolactone decarboxylase family protein [Streptomyces anthocyanicus]
MARRSTNGTDVTFEPSFRIAWVYITPEVFKAMVHMDSYVRSNLDPGLLELMRIGASQIDHCAFCLGIHAKGAFAAGESVVRVMRLNAWEEPPGCYTERELAALDLTEAITVLTDGFVPSEVYDRVAALFSETELAHPIAAIVVVNAWNRFGVAMRKMPGGYAAGAAMMV